MPGNNNHNNKNTDPEDGDTRFPCLLQDSFIHLKNTYRCATHNCQQSPLILTFKIMHLLKTKVKMYIVYQPQESSSQLTEREQSILWHLKD